MIAAVVALIAVIVVVTLSVAYHEMEEAAYYAVDQIVLRNAQTARSVLIENPGDGQSDDLTEIAQSLSGPEGAYSPLYRIWMDGAAEDLLASDPGTSTRYRTLSSVPVSHQEIPDDGQIINIGTGDGTYRAMGFSVQAPGLERPINVLIAVSSDYATHEIGEFRRFMLIFGSVVIIVAGAIGALLVRDIMRPIGRIGGELRQITQENLSESAIDGTSIPSDLRPFADSVRMMLTKLSRAFEREKRFTADAAHELRSPLAVAKSTVQAALSLPEGGRDSVEMARSILEDLNRMECLIQQLLQVARLEAATPGDMECCDLHALLQEACDPYRATEGECRIVIDQPTPSMDVRVQRDDIVRLMTNLIDNALQHGPAEGRVTVSVKRVADRKVWVCVHDEGGQIAPEAIDHLTERFYRVEASRSRASGGVGLGLTIAAEIARRHGSRLDIQSNPEQGTTVSFDLETS
jgi:signal transduction histidine kinase